MSVTGGRGTLGRGCGGAVKNLVPSGTMCRGCRGDARGICPAGSCVRRICSCVRRAGLEVWMRHHVSVHTAWHCQTLARGPGGQRLLREPEAAQGTRGCSGGQGMGWIEGEGGANVWEQRWWQGFLGTPRAPKDIICGYFGFWLIFNLLNKLNYGPKM